MKIILLFCLMTNTYAFFKNPEKQAIDAILAQARMPKTKKNIKKYAPLIINIAKEMGVDYHHALSIAWTESHFNPKALSWVGAQGIMQVMPNTKKAIEKEINQDKLRVLISKNLQYEYETTLNVILGTYYIKKLLKRFNKNQTHATVAYNMGPTWVGRRLKNNKAVGTRNKYLDKVRFILQEIKRKESPSLAYNFKL